MPTPKSRLESLIYIAEAPLPEISPIFNVHHAHQISSRIPDANSSSQTSHITIPSTIFNRNKQDLDSEFRDGDLQLSPHEAPRLPPRYDSQPRPRRSRFSVSKSTIMQGHRMG